jgi:hypothetical protein
MSNLTDEELLNWLKDQWAEEGAAEGWLIKEGLARGLIQQVQHPELADQPWYDFVEADDG